MNRINYWALSLCMLLLATTNWSCNEVECSLTDDVAIIKQYLDDNNLTAIESESGLHYVIEEEGIGNLYPNLNSQVKVVYKGYFTDGEVFDQSPATGVEFSLRGVIAGWQEGIPKFKKSGKGKLLIPSRLGYGTQSVGGIPNRECSVLVFDIELKDFQ